ncbi:MAG: hypothetical protein K9H26_12485 [Prolixibacteraceae bacterium]|nr:hypothetical protein [Prolixibacteraceae bacterium]
MNKMKAHRVILYALIVLMLAACKPSQRQRAVAVINRAKVEIVNGDTLNAIMKLDSVESEFPKATIQIGVARNMKDELYRQLIDTRKNELLAVEKQIEQLEKDFRKEKTEFDMYTQYIHKRQTFNRSWDRSFLQVHLDERGELYLTSHYMGDKRLKHTAIRVYDDTLSQKSGTVPLDDPNNRRSDFLDYKWEKVSYTNGRSDSVIQFITDNADRDLKCVFMGSEYYYILLEDYDIAAVTEALALSEAIKRRKALNKEIAELESVRRAIPRSVAQP